MTERGQEIKVIHLKWKSLKNSFPYLSTVHIKEELHSMCDTEQDTLVLSMSNLHSRILGLDVKTVVRGT